MHSEGGELPIHQAQQESLSVAHAGLQYYIGLNEGCSKALHDYQRAVGLLNNTK